MGIKTAGVGHFTIPTAPAAGTSVTSGAANVFTTTPVQLIASTAAALYITGVHLEAAAAKAATYIVVQLMIGAAAAETIVGQYLVPLSTASTVALGYRQIYPPIPVASGIRISAKTADSVGAAATLVTLECIAQSNVVDDGITVGTVNLVNTLTTYTGNTVQTGDSFLVVKSGGTGDNAAIKAKTDNLPAAPASTTNITAGTITTVTNLTNAPTAGDLTATMKASVTTAATAATPTAAAVTGAVGSVTGAVGSVTGAVGSVTGAVGSVTGNVGGNVVGTVASVVGAVGSVTAGVTLAASQHVIVDSGTVTTLTNLPAITANWLTAAGIAASALNGKGDWNIGKTGYSLTQAFPTNFSAMSLTAGGLVTLAGVTHTGAVIPTVSAVTGLTASNLDAAVSTRLASASYTAPDNGSTTAIKAKTDQLAFTVAGQVDVNLKSVAGTGVIGSGTSGSPWGPA